MARRVRKMPRCLRLQLTGLWRVRFTRFLKRPIVEVEVHIPAHASQDEPFDRFFWDTATPADLYKIGFPNGVNTRRATFAGVEECRKYRPDSKQRTS